MGHLTRLHLDFWDNLAFQFRLTLKKFGTPKIFACDDSNFLPFKRKHSILACSYVAGLLAYCKGYMRVKWYKYIIVSPVSAVLNESIKFSKIYNDISKVTQSFVSWYSEKIFSFYFIMFSTMFIDLNQFLSFTSMLSRLLQREGKFPPK